MEDITRSFLNELKNVQSKDELFKLVSKKQGEFKNTLSKQGIKFYDENHPFPQDIVGGTQIVGIENYNLSRAYFEINYIRRALLASSWSSNLNEPERFSQIQKEVEEILKRFPKGMVKNLSIENFKSIKQLQIDCKRINVFIGKPNVGKSNILEALGMFSSPYRESGTLFFSEYIRYKKLNNLFYDNITKLPITIKTNLGLAYFNYLETINHYTFFLASNEDIIKKSLQDYLNANDIFNKFKSEIDKEKIPTSPIKPLYYFVENSGQIPVDYSLNYWSIFKKYDFKKIVMMNSHFHHFLIPPDGRNLPVILQQDDTLFDDAQRLFDDYNLELFFRDEGNELELQKKIGRRAYSIPYYLIADTLQRMIFYFAAIRSNHDSILIFEEPEAHAFPPYTDMIAEEMIKATSNQFFISTHSPYLLNKLIESCPENELSIFKCRYQDYATNALALTQSEVSEISSYGVDIFYHI